MCRKEFSQQAWGYLERTVCRVVPWMVFGSLDFCSHHSLPNKRVALCACFFLCKQCGLCRAPVLLLGVWNFGRGCLCPCDQSLMKPWAQSLSRVCLIDGSVHVLSQFDAEGIKICMTPLGRDSRTLVSGFLLTLSHVLFTFCWFFFFFVCICFNKS